MANKKDKNKKRKNSNTTNNEARRNSIEQSETNTSNKTTLASTTKSDSPKTSLISKGTSISTWLSLVGALFVLILGVTSVYEIDGIDDVILVNKTAAMTKSRAQLFTYLSKLENMKEWVPGVLAFEPIDNAVLGVGKHYTQQYQSAFYGVAQTKCVIIGYESPFHISWVTDDWLQTRTVWTLSRRNMPNIPTSFTITIYSRRKALLYTHFLLPLSGLFYSQSTRQSLLTIKFMFQSSIMGF